MTRALLRRAFDAALEAVDARGTTAAVLRARPVAGPAYVLALGKAALGMAAGACETCEVAGGLVIAPREPDGPALPFGVEVLRGAHPVPDVDVARRGAQLLEHAAAIPTNATAIVLLSGGGSALVDVPIEGVDAGDIASLTRRLLASGANIDELNAIRVALSRTKGGGLARALGARAVRAIVVSDIAPRGDPARVASGPLSAWTGPSPQAVAARPHVAAALGDLRRFVDAWAPAPTPSITLEVAADNERAVAAAEAALRAEGRRVERGPDLVGEARECGATWANAARTTHADALVAGGETVVTVRGSGRGGRNQELALAARLAGIPGTFLCAGTDGIDGPTHAAGAFVDDDVRARLSDERAGAALDANDATSALEAIDALLVTGATGTNVADLAIWAR